MSHRRTSSQWTILALALLAPFAFAGSARADAVVLRAVTALPRQHALSQSFLHLYVDKVNAAGKGIVQIRYIGGPEVVPPRKGVLALKRGVIDMLHSPTAYYGGIQPEGVALLAANKTPAQVRADGGLAILQKMWEQKLNARIVAWGEWGAQFYLYTDKKPPLKDGRLDLSGFKMRSTGAYRPLLQALGASVVEMPVSNVYTALQRGVVDGFGWPTVGLHNMGLQKAIKYRIDPPFYHLANLVLVNYDKWKSLPPAAKKILLKVGDEYTEASIQRMHEDAEQDTKAALAAGVKIDRLTGAARVNYLNTAYDAMWNYVGQHIKPKELKLLRSKLYQAAK